MNPFRFAIYIAPSPDTPLWRFGSQVLGHDAVTGADLPGFAPRGFTVREWREVTARPLPYGFHGTLKAPFRLAEGRTPEELMMALRGLAARHACFDAGPLAISCLGGESAGDEGFVALTLETPSPALEALENMVVGEIDPFRAPLTPAEIASRQPDRLTPRQRENLHRWGYPFIGADYLFHMTLTGQTAQPERIAAALADDYARQVGAASLRVDALALFAQPEPGGRFRIIERVPLA
jgi:hypothetical protein